MLQFHEIFQYQKNSRSCNQPHYLLNPLHCISMNAVYYDDEGDVVDDMGHTDKKTFQNATKIFSWNIFVKWGVLTWKLGFCF